MGSVDVLLSSWQGGIFVAGVGETMAFYRIYGIGHGGRIEAAENVECASDEEAQMKALEVMGRFPATEVWLGTNRVAQLSISSGR